MEPRPRLESLLPVAITQLTFVAGWPFVSVALNWTWPLGSTVMVEGEMENVGVVGLELGEDPPQPAITSARGAAQAKRRRRSRVMITTIQGVAVIVRARRVCQFSCHDEGVSQKSHGRERRTGRNPKWTRKLLDELRWNLCYAE